MFEILSCIGGGIVIIACLLFMDLFLYTFAGTSVLGIKWK